MSRSILYRSLAIASFAVGIGWWTAWGAAETLQLEPPSLERTLFSKPFHTLTITGPCPEGCQVILRIVSPVQDFKLNKAGKGLSLVWLPVGPAEIQDIPGMCAILSSAKISNILSAAEQRAAGVTSDFKEIYEQSKIRLRQEPPQSEIASLRQEYLSGLLRILTEGRLYQSQEDAVKINSCQFRAQLVYPANAPMGEYTAFCYFVQEGRARLVWQEKFVVKSGGLAEWLSHQARANSAIYGVLAALIAVGAGMLVGVIFRKGAGH